MKVQGVLESSLYCDDLQASAAFYRRLFGFETLFEDDRLCALSVAGKDVLLLFRRGGSLQPSNLSGGVIPPHDGSGALHLAFAIAAEDLPGWEEKLAASGIEIESRVHWPRGGWSLYFRDPDGHLLELVTPGLWAIY
jgi:catechol 2,3-dioxygenase-like lactoylglutathione lyase family enzyme